MADKKKTCFIIMPISIPDAFLDKYRDRKEHFKHVLQCLFIPSVEGAGYKPILPIAKGADLIHAEVIRNLEQSDLVLCDMSCLNPNVFFEFGIRISLNKPVCVVKDELTKKVPFDTAILNHQEYKSTLNPWELPEEIQKLGEHAKAAGERSKGENMLWKYFGLRTEAQPYAGATGTDAKIDYLTMQMDSLRQQMGDLIQRPKQPIVQSEILDSLDEKITKDIITMLPVGVKSMYFAGHVDTGHIEMMYRGTFHPNSENIIRQYIKDLYGVELSFTSLDKIEQKLARLKDAKGDK